MTPVEVLTTLVTQSHDRSGSQPEARAQGARLAARVPTFLSFLTAVAASCRGFLS